MHRTRDSVLTAAALLLVASCSRNGQEAPPPSVADLSPAPITRTDRDRQAVDSAVEAYRAVVRLGLSRERTVVPMRRLRAVVAEPYATRLGRQLAEERTAGIVMRGTEVYTTRSVRVRGDRATVVTCWDPSDSDLVNSYAKPVQPITPAHPTQTTFALHRAGTVWKVTRRTPGPSC